MAHRMGRMTKGNRTKYRRRAYAAGMARATQGARQPDREAARIPMIAVPSVTAQLERRRSDVDDKRAA